VFRRVLNRIYEHLRSIGGVNMVERVFMTDVLDQCIRIAEERRLYKELYKYLLYQAFLLSNPPFISSEGPIAAGNLPAAYLPRKTLEYFKNASKHRTIEMAIAFSETATLVAERHNLGSCPRLAKLIADPQDRVMPGTYKPPATGILAVSTGRLPRGKRIPKSSPGHIALHTGYDTSSSGKPTAPTRIRSGFVRRSSCGGVVPGIPLRAPS
jgi:hypothetical protein